MCFYGFVNLYLTLSVNKYFGECWKRSLIHLVYFHLLFPEHFLLHFWEKIKGTPIKRQNYFLLLKIWSYFWFLIFGLVSYDQTIFFLVMFHGCNWSLHCSLGFIYFDDWSCLEIGIFLLFIGLIHDPLCLISSVWLCICFLGLF
jgi:hypothetical protein